MESPFDMKIGISENALAGAYPLNGLRHPPEGDTTGWYIWSGEFSLDPNFFVPMHTSHLFELRPEIIPYLGLGPGWRFLIAPKYEDVWEDLSLLQI